MYGQKDPQIALGNADDTPKPMHSQVAGLDPAPNGTGRDAETIGDVFNCVEMSWTSDASIGVVGARGRPSATIAGLSFGARSRYENLRHNDAGSPRASVSG